MKILLILGMIFGWGFWGFFLKLSDKRIGQQVAFWDSIALLIVIILYLVFSNQLFPLKNDTVGISWGILAGVAAGAASIFLFVLLSKNPVGYLVTLSALYPAITIILSVIFLHEQITPVKAIGFIFAFMAFILLAL
jgi:transporter family protein